jgi:hypothetical protein
MKKAIMSLLAPCIIILVACNNGSDKKTSDQDTSQMKDTSSTATVDTSNLKEISPSFTNVDPKTTSSINTIINNYLQTKKGLVNDDGSEAANGGKEMDETISKVDKSLLTAEQKKVYDDIVDDLKEHAEHIGENASKIEHQREHFSMMSEDVYDLAKAFGSGIPLYHIHCSMYNEGKGAMWLSESGQIKNPYYGSKMIKCGDVMEKIK